MKKFLGISGLLLAIATMFVAITFLSRLSQFRSEVARLKSEGQPVSIADLNENGTVADKETLKLLNRLWEPIVAFETEMWEYLPEEYNLDQPANDAMVGKFHELNDAFPTVFPLIEQIAEQDKIETNFAGDSEEYVDGLMGQAARFRSLARVLGWRMRIAVAEGNPDEAFADGIRILKLSRMTAQHPMLIGYLTSEAVRGMGLQFLYALISEGEISDDTRAILNAELEAQEAREILQTALESERAYGIASMIDTGTIQLAYGGVGYLNMIQKMIDRSKTEPFQQERLTDPGTVSVLFNGIYGELVRPAISQATETANRTRSQVRALRIISALQSATDIPDSLTQDYLIGIGVPKEMTIDTMTGQTMLINKEDGKLNVYSVGINGKDDGGSTKGNMDYGFDQ